MSDGYRDLHVASVVPWIANDIKSHQQVSVRVMLDVLLNRCLISSKSEGVTGPKWDPGELLHACLEAIIPVCNTVHFRRLLNDCCKPVNKEADRYTPFVRLFNHGLSQLASNQSKPNKGKTNSVADQLEDLGLLPSSDLDILFHRSDPNEVKATHGRLTTERKPDIVVVSLDDARRSADPLNKDGQWRDFATMYATNDPRSEHSKNFQGFQWHDMLSVTEVKLVRKSLTRPPDEFSMDQFREVPAAQNIHAVPSTVVPRSETTAKGKGKEKAVDSGLLDFLPSERRYPTRGNKEVHSEPIKSSKRPLDAPASSGDFKKRKIEKDEEIDDIFSLGKADDDAQVQPPLIQSAIYGSEMLSRGVYATHALNSLIVDDVVWLWWYDRQGAIQSTGINFIQDWPYFMVLLVIFQRFDLKDWGIEPTLTHADRRGTTPVTYEVLDGSDIIIRIGGSKPYLQRYSLNGRATQILAAMSDSIHPKTKESLAGKELALKSYWPELSRHNEAEMIAKAVHYGEQDRYIKGHLPDLICWFDIKYSTGTIRNELHRNENPQAGDLPSKGFRTLRFLLFIRLQPLYKVSVKLFIRAWRDCYRCHYRLWSHGVEHGDISFQNLMWNPTTKCGVLNDFDLASLRDERTENGERTGTIPFMALELLTQEYFDGEVVRLYRHDLESFVWVLAWYWLKRSNSDQADAWQTGNFVACNAAKHTFISTERYGKIDSTPRLRVLWKLNQTLLSWVKDRLAAQTRKTRRLVNPTLDDEDDDDEDDNDDDDEDEDEDEDDDNNNDNNNEEAKFSSPAILQSSEVAEEANDVIFRAFETQISSAHAAFTVMVV